MFGEPKEITIKQVLDKVSEYQIFRAYIKEDFIIGSSFSSPLRVDNNPSFSIYQTSSGRLFFKDFATGEQGGCFDFIQKKFGCTFFESLLIVDNDFNLGLYKSKVRKTIPVEMLLRYKPKQREAATIQISKRSWNYNDKKYWFIQYGITSKILESYDICAVSAIKLNGKIIVYNDVAYAFKFDNGIYKIYAPYNKIKFITNATKDYYQGFNQLPWVGDLLLITKSMKDILVLSLLNYIAIAPQSESQTPSYEFIQKLKQRFKKVLVFFDNDKAGIMGAFDIYNTHGINSIIIPVESNIKDISDYIKDCGKYKTKDLLKYLI